MEINPCEGKCFAVKKLVNKLEKEVEFWQKEAAYFERRMIYWRSNWSSTQHQISPHPKKKKHPRPNPQHLQLVASKWPPLDRLLRSLSLNTSFTGRYTDG